jgi:hydroxymethylbilane synthase
MQKIIRIGTRDSDLALWQAKTVQQQLEYLGHKTEIVAVKATGDLVLDKPLYELGITGIFTKNLDIALLNDEIDIAVHSLKDVPTVLPKSIVQAAVLKRGNSNDMLVLKDNEEFMAQKDAIVATGSLRRKAQWLNRFPTHTISDIRGNVITRLEKLENNDWNAAIFAAAGLERLKIKPSSAFSLDWMIPAPAQGVVSIAALAENEELLAILKELNDEETEMLAKVERDFLNLLEGGCTAPIGALAFVKEDEVYFKGVLLNPEGTKRIDVTSKEKIGRHNYIAKECADFVLNRGGKEIMASLKGEDKKEYSVFSTKKLSEIQKRLLAEKVGVEDSDFIKIRFNSIAPKVVKNEIENVIITSKNGVESLLNSFIKQELQFKNIYCVGRRTKKLIEQKIGKVAHSEKNAEKLAVYLSENIKGQEVTYFCSDLRLDTLPTVLKENGVSVNEIEAYKTMYSPVNVREQFSGVLFYSPSTVESYMQDNSTDKIAFCIGESTAKEARKYFENVQVAKLPTVESVLELVNLHYVKA